MAKSEGGGGGGVASFIANRPKVQSKASGDDSISGRLNVSRDLLPWISARIALISSGIGSLVEKKCLQFSSAKCQHRTEEHEVEEAPPKTMERSLPTPNHLNIDAFANFLLFSN